MATYYSNRPIVTDGLGLFLDASNPKSYAGSGANWKDLTGNNHNASFTGSISFDATDKLGSFRSNDTQIADIIGMPISALSSLTSGNNWSMEFWARKDSTEGTEYMCSMATSGDSNHFMMEYDNFTDQLSIWPNLITSPITGSLPVVTTGIPFQFTLVYDTSVANTITYYFNGTRTTSYTNTLNDITLTEGWTLNQEQDAVWGSYAAAQCWPGNFYMVKLYDKSLTSDEVKQNFNAHRGRFDI